LVTEWGIMEYFVLLISERQHQSMEYIIADEAYYSGKGAMVMVISIKRRNKSQYKV
jgi:hypothetical protein